MAGAGSVGLEVLAMGDAEILARPCVDCGLVTGCYCDSCIASERMPGEMWAKGQMTPLCSSCDRERGACHFVLERAGLDRQHGQSKDGQWSYRAHSSIVVL